jgi:hypothetical protein
LDQDKRQDRLTLASDKTLDAGTLIGSYFHSNADHGWQGCVVAEPAPGTYLVELFSWVMGESTCQLLVRLDEMFGWQFYDDAGWMKNAYEHGVEQRWDRERGSSGSEAK